MLVLSRKTGESIVIGNDIKVSIVKVQGRRIRIGIEAPDHVGIRRAEIDVFDDSHVDSAKVENRNLDDSCAGFELISG